MKKTAIARLLLTFAAISDAQAGTITFDALEKAGTSFTYMASYSELGFQFTTGIDQRFGSAEQGNTNWYAGSAGLFSDFNAASITLAQLGGGAFNLNSIDLSMLSATFSGGGSVAFTGHVHGGGTVTQTFGPLAGTLAFTTFAFSGFNNLDSVTWTQASAYHQFDNLVLEAAAANGVPEPETIALAGLALAGLALSRRGKS